MSALVLLAIGVLGFGGWYLFMRDPSGVKAHAEARRFQERITNFRQHTNTLEKHSDEYCAVFNGNEWNQLNETLTRLEHIDTEVRLLLAGKQYSQAITVLARINNPLNAPSPMDEVSHNLQHLEDLMNWELSVHSMLKKVVLNLEVAATNTKQLSEAKPLSRTRPTLVTLADIKKVLLEDEDIRKMSS
jgi:hypothetical protein